LLSGYSARKTESEGIADSLFVRALVLWPGDSPPLAIVSVDCIGIPGAMTNRIAKVALERWGIRRARLVLSATHSHSAPHIDGFASNLFSHVPTDDQRSSVQRYSERVEETIVKAIERAMKEPKHVRLRFGTGKAPLAVNRRVLEKGRWKGFGNQSDGIVDHRIGIVAIEDLSGKLEAVLYNYACHATSIHPKHNQVSGDWPGLSSAILDETLNTVSFPIIGCAGDMGPRQTGEYNDAKANAVTIAKGVEDALKEQLQVIDQEPRTEFGYAGLPSEHPTREQLKTWLEGPDVHYQRYAKELLATWERRGVLPETYPAPVRTWTFGDQLTWVFLGGEVVLQYQLRLDREVPAENVWVSSYCDDAFGYVASEKMRSEGGYEVDYSMVYYMLPGRWQTGTEDLLVRRVLEIRQGSDKEHLPLSPEDALKRMEVTDEFVVEQVVSEPLIQDPVNFAFDNKGRLWVVEMRDYPLGTSDGGCIKVLSDTNQDGQMDSSQVFLDRLKYPNSVFPYRDGAIVACAPEVFFAADRDGDGYAEYREDLILGFPQTNPQHRVNGFTFGLDGKLYFSSGEDATSIRVAGSAEPIRASGRDLAFDLETRQLEVVSGPTQYIRGRDDWDRWFGNTNNEPIYQYVIDERYQQRSGRSINDSFRKFLTSPAVGPRVFPLSSADGRFNDVFSANRFTSACSSVICRTRHCGDDMVDAAMICEPVHNLIHRLKLVSSGASLSGERFAQDQQSEWIRSSDPWFRPVRIETGPDGAVWFADMYRLVIEHPQWIPEAWQERIDLRGGDDKGRIYRIRHRNHPSKPLPILDENNPNSIAASLQSEVGPLRDLAQQWIIQNRPEQLRETLIGALREHQKEPRIRIQLLATLDCCGWLDDGVLAECISTDQSPRVIQFALDLAQKRWNETTVLREAVFALSPPAIDDELAMHVILLLGIDSSNEATQTIVRVAKNRESDPWIQRAIRLALPIHQKAVIAELSQRWMDGRVSSSDSAIEGRRNELLFVGQLLKESTVPLLEAEQISGWIEQLSSGNEADSSMLPIIAAWLRSEDDPSTITLSSSLTAIIDSSPRLVENEALPVEQRAAAVYLVGWSNSQADRLEKRLNCFDPRFPLLVQETALDCILESPTDEAIDLLISKWGVMTPALRLQLTGRLLQKPRWTLRLLDAIEKKIVRTTELDAASIQSMLNPWDRSIQPSNRYRHSNKQQRMQMISMKDKSFTFSIAQYATVLGTTFLL
jgi:putative membrane-bound dehydrogenase-like protein